MNVKFCIVFLLLVTFQTAFASDFPLWGGLKPGPYAAGFEAKLQYDYSRTFLPKYDYQGKQNEGPRHRPVQTLIWYPAKATATSKFMIYQEYIDLISQELTFDSITDESRNSSSQQYIQRRTNIFNVSENGIAQLSKMNTGSIRNAVRANGKFPLIIYAPGAGGFAFENSVFCEYLASHGYIVAAMPSMGANSRNASVDLTGFYAYMQDIEFVIGSLHQYPNIDPDRLGIAGFSMGGSAAALVQMRNTDIDAAVYFDTGIIFGLIEGLFSSSNYYDKNSFRAPQLYLTRSDSPGIDANFLDSIYYADVYSFMIHEGYRHQDFISEGMFAGKIPGYLKEKRQGDSAKLYETICMYAQRFLDAYVKKDSSAAELLARSLNETKTDEMITSAELKKAAKAPPREWEIAEMIRTSRSVEKAKPILLDFASQNHSAIRETTLNQLGYEFMFQGNMQLSIEVFELNVLLFPKSANVYDSLSDAYDRSGDKASAIKHAEKALELLSSDQGINEQRREVIRRSAEDRLKRLRS